MTGSEPPAAALFHKRIRKLNNDIDWFTLGVALNFRLARDDRSVVVVNSHLHIVIFENIVMNPAASGVFDVVGGRADFAL